MSLRLELKGGEEEIFRLLWRLGVLTAGQAAVLYRENAGCDVRWAQETLSRLRDKGIAYGERRSPRWGDTLRGARPLCYILTEEGIEQAGRRFDDLAPVTALKTYHQAYRPSHFDHAMLRNEYIVLVADDARKPIKGIPQGLKAKDICAEPLAWRAAHPRARKQRRGISRPDGAFWLCKEGDPSFDRRLVLVEAHTGSQDTRTVMGSKIDRYCSDGSLISEYIWGIADPEPKPRVVFICPDQNTAVRARKLAHSAVTRTADSKFVDLARKVHTREQVADLFLFASLDDLRDRGSLSAAYAPLDDTDYVLTLL